MPTSKQFAMGSSRGETVCASALLEILAAKRERACAGHALSIGEEKLLRATQLDLIDEITNWVKHNTQL